MKTLQIIFLLFISCSFISAQAPDTLWTKAYGGPSSEMAYNVVEVPDGGFLSCGNTRSFSKGTDIYVVRMDANGETLWTNVIGDTVASESVFSLEATRDGGYILCGTKYAGESNVYLLKLDKDCQFEWEQSLGVTGTQENGVWAVQTADDGYAVCASTREAPGGSGIKLFKTDPAGMPEDSVIYGWKYSDDPGAISNCADGGFVIAGRTNSYGNNKFETYLFKVDENLDSLWFYLYGDGELLDERMNHVFRTSDDGFLMVGAQGERPDVSNQHQLFVVKTDSEGIEEWQKLYGRKGHDVGWYGAEVPAGGYVICGSGVSADWRRSNEVFVVRLKADGDTLWTGYYGTEDFDESYCIKPVSSGGYIIAGDIPNDGDNQCYFIRLDDDAVSVDYTLMNEGRVSAYPNPFREFQIMNYELREAGYVSLKVYDVMGNEVATLADGYQADGRHEARFEGSGIPAGVYYYVLQAGERISRQLIIKNE